MDGHPVTTTNPESKKSSKPVMEKRRRARINASLAELKSLLLDAIKMEGTRHSKMEKADILELAVRHLKDVHTHPFSAATNPSSSLLSKYVMGFQACAGEVSKYLNTGGYEDFTLKSKLLNHLADCLAGGDDNTTNSTEISSSTLPISAVSAPIRPVTDDGHCNNSILPSTLLSPLSSSDISESTSNERDYGRRSALNQSLVSSSTQPSHLQLLSKPSSSVPAVSSQGPVSPALSSSFHSSVPTHLNPRQPNEPTFATSLFSTATESDIEEGIYLNRKDVTTSAYRESVIVTSKDDDDNDNSFNDTDDDDSEDALSSSESKERGNSVGTPSDMNNNIPVLFHGKTQQPMDASPLAIPQEKANSLTLASTPLQTQHIMPIQTLSESHQTFQNQSPSQNLQPLISNLNQQLAGLSALPFMGQNIRFLSAQPNTNEFALIVPANIIPAKGGLQSLYIPLLQSQTLQNQPTAAFFAPQIISPNPTMPSMQLQPLQQTSLTSNPQSLVSRVNQDINVAPTPKQHQPSVSIAMVTSTDTRDKNCLVHQHMPNLGSKTPAINIKMTQDSNVSQSLPVVVDTEKKNSPSEHGSTSSSNNSVYQSFTSGQFSTDASLMDASKSFCLHVEDKPQPCALHNSPSLTDVELQQSRDRAETGSNHAAVDTPLDYHIDPIPKHPSHNAQNIDKNSNRTAQNLLHYNNLSTLPNPKEKLDPSTQHVINNSPSVNDHNTNHLLFPTVSNQHTVFNKCNLHTDTNHPTADSSKTESTIDNNNNKRPLCPYSSPPPTKTYKRFHSDYTRSKGGAYSENGLDLSVPASKQENDRVPRIGYKSFVHGSGIKRSSPMVVGVDDTSLTTAQENTPAAANNDSLCKGSFFRPW